jgi:magnesium transporter
MITYYVHRAGETIATDRFDESWLESGSGAVIWAEVREPTAEDADQLRRAFGLHPLSIEDALQPLALPKVESYGSYLYVVLHGIDFKRSQHAFETQDVDFFLGRNYLVTVQDGGRRSIAEITALCVRNPHVMGEGAAALMHRIVDRMVQHYRPEVEELEEWLDELERRVVEGGDGPELTAEILAVKRDLSSFRRIVLPQRDVVGRLARREFEFIDQEHAYRFRDVYDQFVQLTDEAYMFQDRITGILDAHLTTVSNRLSAVSKVLTAFAVILGPLTVITGLFGMNVELPELPGGPGVQFWWIMGIMAGAVAVTYAAFRRKGWL